MNKTGKAFLTPQSAAKNSKNNKISKNFFLSQDSKRNKEKSSNLNKNSNETPNSQQNQSNRNEKQEKNEFLDSTHSSDNFPNLSSSDDNQNVNHSLDDSEALLQMVENNNVQLNQIYSTASEFSDEEIIPRQKKNTKGNDKKENTKNNDKKKVTQNSGKKIVKTARTPQIPNLTKKNNTKVTQKANNSTVKPQEAVMPKIIHEDDDYDDEDEIETKPKTPKQVIEDDEEEDSPDVIAQKRLNINVDDSSSSDDDSFISDDNDVADSEDDNTMPSPPLHESQNAEIKAPLAPLNKHLEIHNLQAPRPPPEFDDDEVYLEIQPQKKRPPPMWDSDENGNPIHRKKIAIQETAPRKEFKGFDDLDLDDDSDDLINNEQNVPKPNNETLTTPTKQPFHLEKINEQISSDMFAESSSENKQPEEEKKEEPATKEEKKEEPAIETPKKSKRKSTSPSKLSPTLSLEEQNRRRRKDPNKSINYIFPPTGATEVYQQMLLAKQKRMGIVNQPEKKPVKKPRKTAPPSKIPISPKMRVRIQPRIKSPSPPPPEPKTLKDFEEHDDDPNLYVHQVEKPKENNKSKTSPIGKKNAIQLPQFVKTVVSVKKATVTLKEQKEKQIVQQEREKEKEKERKAEMRAMDNNVSIVNQTPGMKEPTNQTTSKLDNYYIDDELALLLAKKELLEREINNLEVQNTEFSTMTNEDIFLVTKYQSIVLSSVNEYMSGVLRSVAAHNERLYKNNQEMRTLNTELEKIAKSNKHFNTIKFSTNRLRTMRKELLQQINTIQDDMKNNQELAETIITSRSNIEAEAADLTTEALALQEEVEDLQQRIKEIEDANLEDESFGSLSKETREQLQQEKDLWDKRMKQLDDLFENNIRNSEGNTKIKKKDSIDRSVFDDGPSLSKDQLSIQQSYYIIERSKDQSAKEMLEKLRRDYNENQLKLEDVDISVYQNLEEQEKLFTDACNLFNVATRSANNLQSKLVNSDASYSDLNIRVNLLVNQIKDESFDYQKQVKHMLDDNFIMFFQRVNDDDIVRKVSIWADKKFPECRTKSTVIEKLKFIQTKLKA